MSNAIIARLEELGYVVKRAVLGGLATFWVYHNTWCIGWMQITDNIVSYGQDRAISYDFDFADPESFTRFEQVVAVSRRLP